MVGALCGGAVGATTLTQIPLRMAAFSAITLLLETVDASGAASFAHLKEHLDFSTPGLEERKRWRYVGNRPRKYGPVGGPRTNIFGEPVGAGVRSGSRLERWIESLNRELGHKD